MTYDNRVSCYCWLGYPLGAFPIPFCPLLNAGTDIVQPSSKARGPPCCLHLFSGVPPTRQTLQDRVEWSIPKKKKRKKKRVWKESNAKSLNFLSLVNDNITHILFKRNSFYATCTGKALWLLYSNSLSSFYILIWGHIPIYCHTLHLAILFSCMLA